MSKKKYKSTTSLNKIKVISSISKFRSRNLNKKRKFTENKTTEIPKKTKFKILKIKVKLYLPNNYPFLLFIYETTFKFSLKAY